MKALLASFLILSLYFISCYPQKKILGYYPNGKPKSIRYTKHADTTTERYVFYYDNGQKQFVRYWGNDMLQVFRMKAWYKSGAKRMKGWMKEKDMVKKYDPSDSMYVYTGLNKEFAEGWYENGKLMFKTAVQGDTEMMNYYDEQGIRTSKKNFGPLRPDGYDTVEFKARIKSVRKWYMEPINRHGSSNLLLEE